MLMLVVRAFAVGVIASCLLGPAAMLVMQKSLCHGHRTGFVTALGVTTVDTLWAMVSALAMTAARDFIGAYSSAIMLVGGCVVVCVGFGMAFINPFRRFPAEREEEVSIKDYGQAFLTAASNPGALFVMLTLFAFMGLGGGGRYAGSLLSVAGVAAGSVTYWFFFTWLCSGVRKSFRPMTIVWIDRIAGVAVMLIGAVLAVEGLRETLI